ncbi:MAG: hypothetical protein JSV17_15070 [Candidatus Aminicenantes bacterium]|nr:MAG: hypothetical protein JSV17_15070 [Candidatus Aminicenantes bacterium]
MKKAKFLVLSIVGIIFFSLIVASLSAVQNAKYEGLLGEWDVQTEDGQYTFVFIFSMEGENLKGLFKGTSGDYEMEDLSYKGNELSFTVNIDAGGQTMTIDYSATIKEDTLEGYLSMEYGEANITGKKRK